MWRKSVKALGNVHLDEGGITGLETAIVLIAFVTIASVLAYSILSAGIFSAEKAKETIYKGLEQSESSIELSSVVLGLSANQTELEAVQFFIGLTMLHEKVDTQAIIINYWDKEVHSEGCTATLELASDSTERGTANILERDEQFKVTVTVPGAANVTAYDTFTVQVLPPTGNAITITRSLPGSLLKVMDLK